jgi:hypothetical protein
VTTPIANQPDTRPTTSETGFWTTGRKPTSRLRSPKRRHSIPHLVLGVLLVLACATAFAVLSLVTGDKQPVLALARPVMVGQVLTAEDLRQVNVSLDPGVSVVDAGQAAAVVGRTMTESLPAGALLTGDAVSGPGVPTAGQALAALALKPGQFPPEVSPGAHVSVVYIPGQNSNPPTSDAATVWPAVVTSVTSSASQQATVVSVEVAQAAAPEIAAVPVGQLSLVMLPGGA